MSPAQRRHSLKNLPLLSVLGFLVLVALIYALVRWTGSGEVLGSVTVLDVELGGATPEAAADLLVELEDRLATTPVPVRVVETDTEIIPAHAGFDLDEESLVDAAMAVGRSDNPLSDFFWWISHIGRSTPLVPEGELDATALDEVLETFDTNIIGEPPYEGGIALSDGQLVASYPRAGRRVDREEAQVRVTEVSLRLERSTVTLPVRNEQPELTDADVDRARADAEFMLSAPVVLATEDGTTATFSVDDLRAAFLAETLSDPARIELGFDPEVVETNLEPLRSDFESEPVNARFEIDGYQVNIVPGRNGTRLDAEETATVLEEAARATDRRARLPLVDGSEPDRTTDDLEALDIRHLVSQFTTYHDPFGARVTNIHLIADRVDGAIVAPGQSFSLNDYVGQRTEAEGYLPAGTIVGGEIIDTVGGGVSQFATTFYNAVFWGGYEDVEHKPHSFYYSRYPEGIEATISWPLPDLVFRNNTDSGVLIRTSYTDSSITVRFYGNNDGRILAGEQSGGSMGVGVVAEGGSSARQVRGDRSDRRDFRDPPDPLYRGSPELDVDEERTVQGPREGWSLTVTRTITVGDNTTTQEWVVRYLPQQEIIEVHPCRAPGGGPCPTTTTTTSTTVPPDTTTTTTEPDEPPDTTTTTEPPPTTVPEDG